MASVLGYEVEGVFLGFTFVTLFVTVLFALAHIIMGRQYRLLREQFDKLRREVGGEAAAARSIAEEAVEAARQAKHGGGAPQAFEKKIAELEGKQRLLSEVVGGLRSSGGAGVDVGLRKKISLVKKLERQAGLQAAAVLALRREIAFLKREFQKHEITPLHEGGEESVAEEVNRAFDELVNVESKVNKLAKKLAQAQRKVAKAKKLAETEPKKRVSKKVFKKTVGAIKRKIEGGKKAKSTTPQEKPSPPAPTQVTIQTPAPVEVSVEKKLFG